jgi:predicted amidohydrolase
VSVIIGATTHKGAFPGDIYNSALVFGPNGLIGVYSKTHLAAYGAQHGAVVAERAWWSPGHDIPVLDTPVGRIGIEICYDISFPEVARTLTLKGAELIVNVSAAIRDDAIERYWDHILYTRSQENAIPYLHASIVGKQPNAEYFGGRRLYSPTARSSLPRPGTRRASPGWISTNPSS